MVETRLDAAPLAWPNVSTPRQVPPHLFLSTGRRGQAAPLPRIYFGSGREFENHAFAALPTRWLCPIKISCRIECQTVVRSVSVEISSEVVNNCFFPRTAGKSQLEYGPTIAGRPAACR